MCLVSVLITNSNVKHQLTGSEYPERRAACLDSARAMSHVSLRDVDMDTLLKYKDKFDPVTYRRVKHVVTEIERLLFHTIVPFIKINIVGLKLLLKLLKRMIL